MYTCRTSKWHGASCRSHTSFVQDLLLETEAYSACVSFSLNKNLFFKIWSLSPRKGSQGKAVGSHLCRSQIQGRRELNPDQPSHLWSMWAPLTWSSPKETTIILPGGSRLRCKEQFARFPSDQVVCSRARSEENRQGPDRAVSWGRIKIFLISSYALTASHHPFPDDTFWYVPMISQGSVGNPVRLSQCSVIS